MLNLTRQELTMINAILPQFGVIDTVKTPIMHQVLINILPTPMLNKIDASTVT